MRYLLDETTKGAKHTHFQLIQHAIGTIELGDDMPSRIPQLGPGLFKLAGYSAGGKMIHIEMAHETVSELSAQAQEMGLYS